MTGNLAASVRARLTKDLARNNFPICPASDGRAAALTLSWYAATYDVPINRLYHQQLDLVMPVAEHAQSHDAGGREALVAREAP
jgi:hypothetical protein